MICVTRNVLQDYATEDWVQPLLDALEESLDDDDRLLVVDKIDLVGARIEICTSRLSWRVAVTDDLLTRATLSIDAAVRYMAARHPSGADSAGKIHVYSFVNRHNSAERVLVAAPNEDAAAGSAAKYLDLESPKDVRRVHVTNAESCKSHILHDDHDGGKTCETGGPCLS